MFSFAYRYRQASCFSKLSFPPKNNVYEPPKSLRGEFLYNRNKAILQEIQDAELLLLLLQERLNKASASLTPSAMPPFDQSSQSSNDESTAPLNTAAAEAQGARVWNPPDSRRSTKTKTTRPVFRAKKRIVSPTQSTWNRVRQNKQNIHSEARTGHQTLKSTLHQHPKVTAASHRTKRSTVVVTGTTDGRPTKHIRRFQGFQPVSGAKRRLDPNGPSTIGTDAHHITKLKRRFKGYQTGPLSGVKRSIESCHLPPKKHILRHHENGPNTLVRTTAKRTFAESQEQGREHINDCPVFLINRERFRRPTLNRLVRNPVLDCIAHHHATTMAKMGHVHHSVSSGEKLQAKLGHEMVGENVFRGDSILAMHNETMLLTNKGSVRQRNILSPYIREIGSAVVLAKDGKLYSCQAFRG